MAGFAGFSSKNFCSFCRQKKDDIDDIDTFSWQTRTLDEHRKQAEAWRDAVSEEARQALFDTHGIRYSEFLRLPYWDPTKYTVIDPMHAILLGNLRHHCRDIWGMDSESPDGDGTVRSPVEDEPITGPSDESCKAGQAGRRAKLRIAKSAEVAKACRSSALMQGNPDDAGKAQAAED